MSVALRITERDWQTRVIDAAKLFGWRYAHFRSARTAKGWKTAMEGDKGFPDLVLVKPPRVIFVELKSDQGKLSIEQFNWMTALEAGNVEAYVWRPENWQEAYLTLAKERR